MARFTVSYLPTSGRDPLVVEAERYEQQGRHWVFWGTHTLMNRTRDVIVLRLAVEGIASISRNAL